MNTGEICMAGNIVSGAMPVDEAVKNPGVYYFKDRAPSAALVIMPDVCLYVNDGHVTDYEEGMTRERCYLTDVPLPLAILS